MIVAMRRWLTTAAALLVMLALTACGTKAKPRACRADAQSQLRTFAAAVSVRPGGELMHQSGPSCDEDNSPATSSMEYGYRVAPSISAERFAADIGRDLAARGWTVSNGQPSGPTIGYERTDKNLRYTATVQIGNTYGLGDVLLIFGAQPV